MSKVEGGLLIARALAEEGITHVTGLCGGHIAPILHGCKELGIRVVDTRHEAAAVHMASGFAEVTGKPGVAMVTAGPGVTNTFGAMGRANYSDVPILLIGGASPISRREMMAQQEIDSVRYMEPVTRWGKCVDDARRLQEYVHAAFRYMLSGRTGPVFLTVPIEVPYTMVEEEDVVIAPRQKTARPSADEEAVKQAVALLEKAERPVLLVGRDSRWGHAEEAIGEFIRSTGIPLLTDFFNRAPVPEDERLHLGVAVRGPGAIGQFALEQADVVLVAGLNFDYNYGYGGCIGKDAKIIHIRIDPAEVGRNRQADVGIAADSGLALKQIAAAFDRRRFNQPGHLHVAVGFDHEAVAHAVADDHITVEIDITG